MLSFLPSPDALPPLDLALDCLPQEVCSFLAIFEKGVDPRQRPRREAGGHTPRKRLSHEPGGRSRKGFERSRRWPGRGADSTDVSLADL
jgi:hypothetical protein